MLKLTITFLAGALAFAYLPFIRLNGLPLIAYLLGTAAAFLTAFYTGRQIGLTFFGAPRHEASQAARESPPTMTLPLVVLALFTLLRLHGVERAHVADNSVGGWVALVIYVSLLGTALFLRWRSRAWQKIRL